MEERAKQFELIKSNEREIEIARYDFIEALLHDLEFLNKVHNDIKNKLDRMEIVCDRYETDLRASKNEKEKLEKQVSSHPFVLLLVDGDDTLFLDAYVKNGEGGGHDAARDLRSAVEKYLEQIQGSQSHWEVVIRIYAKFSGLGKTYVDAGIVQDYSAWHRFVQGFNAAFEYCEYIDAGRDKEGADNKIKSNLNLFFGNVHCKHILLAASGDKSYTGPLRRFTHTDRQCEEITLVEALPFPGDLKGLADKFLKTSFSDIFRTSKFIVDKRDQSKVPDNLTFASAAARVAPEPTMALATTAPTSSRSTINGNISLVSGPATKRLEPIKICFNQYGERLDPVLARWDNNILKELKSRKLCNRHFLTRCTKEPCLFEHNGALGPNQMNALRRIARMSPCDSVSCRDPLCVMAHRCLYDGSCEYGNGCKFGSDMHNIDTKIVKTESFNLNV